jgi:hypothetical protein
MIEFYGSFSEGTEEDQIIYKNNCKLLFSCKTTVDFVLHKYLYILYHMSSLCTCTLPVYLNVNFIRRAMMYNKI